MSRVTWGVLCCALCLTSVGAARGESITLRSGQVGGLPGSPGQPDDTVRFLNNNPPGAPISAVPFTPADFSGASAGAAAKVINPVGVWLPSLSDPAARWIDFDTQAGDFGASGSALYAVPFFVTTPGATSANLNMEFCFDDGAGDFVYGGANPSFLYVNGIDTGATSTVNYAAAGFHSQTIGISSGWNTIYLYQRDQGLGVSGMIFSMTLDVVPEPGTAALLAVGGLLLARRRSMTT